MKAVGKIRSPWMVMLLSILTLGFYSLYYWFVLFQEVKDYRGRGLGGAMALLMQFLVIPSIALPFMLPSEIGQMYTEENQVPPVTGASGFWLFLPIAGGFVWLFKCQGALNTFWQARGATP